jgi:SOS-response transcriptional repressor LexA
MSLPTFSVLQVETASNDLAVAGILLSDPSSGRLGVRLRRDWERIAREDDVEVLELLGDQLERMAAPGDLGTEGLLNYLEGSASQLLRVQDREPVEVFDFDWSLNRLYRKYVQSSVQPFQTHLPLYTLRAAAGKFLDNEEVTEESWVETPERLRLTPDMFLARIVGHSMEPAIPDGAVCAFRHGVTGSRENRLVLAEDRQSTGDQRYSVKRYRSEKAASGGTWKHTRIRLESLNPEYPSWDLDPQEDQYAIVASFVQVIE